MSKLREIILGVILFHVFIVASVFVSPPDVVSQIVILFEMFILFGVMIFVIYRFMPIKQAPQKIKMLIIVMACLLSITTILSIQLCQNISALRKQNDNYSMNQVDESSELDVFDINNIN